VRTSGTDAVVELATQRWFGTGFIDRQPDVVAALVAALRNTDNESYAQACEALAEFDVTDRLGEITTPVLAIAGAPRTSRRRRTAWRASRPGSRTDGWSCSTVSDIWHPPRLPTEWRN
jgi:hypothetical protein